jgi:hypothetical protein
MSVVGEFCRRNLMSCRPKKWRIGTVYGLAFVGLTALIGAQHLECQRLRVRATVDAEMGRELDSERRVLSEHCLLKRIMIDELTRGRLTLQEAVSGCLQIDHNWPLVIANIRRCYFGDTDMEKEARCLAFIACSRPMKPDDRVQLAARLSAEFRELFPTANELMVSVPS